MRRTHSLRLVDGATALRASVPVFISASLANATPPVAADGPNLVLITLPTPVRPR